MKFLPTIRFLSALLLSNLSIVGCGALSGLDGLTATSCFDGCEGGEASDGSTADDRAGQVDAFVDAQGSDVSTARDVAVGDAVAADTAPDAPGVGADGGSITMGLVAFYPFDEASGTTSVDASGNGHTATMLGAAFASGLHGNAATMNGSNQYVSLPSGIVSGLSSVSIAAWVRVIVSPTWNRVFDFGIGTNVYMYLTPNSGGSSATRFTIATNGLYNQQDLSGPPLPTNSWQHVCVTLTAGAPYSTNILYINGIQVGQNTTTTITPADLGNTTSNWLGRSHAPTDPFFNGQIDNFRIYNRPLSAFEIQQLFQQQL